MIGRSPNSARVRGTYISCRRAGGTRESRRLNSFHTNSTHTMRSRIPRSRAWVPPLSLLTSALVAIFGFECLERIPRTPLPAFSFANTPIDDVAGVWVTPDSGFLKQEVQLDRSGKSSYSIFTDVIYGDESRFPIQGTWQWSGSVLQISGDKDSFDLRFYPARFQGEFCLAPEFIWEEWTESTEVDRRFLLFRKSFPAESSSTIHDLLHHPRS